jgi:deoxyribose-phosphate aldolase
MDLHGFIDHTILKPDCSGEDVQRVCEEAIAHQFAAVCIPPYYVKTAHQLLEGSSVKVATVIGFPLGYNPTPAKVEEVKKAIDEGADEVDAVVNICAVKNGNWNYVTNDIESMVTIARLRGKLSKIILETGLMTDEEIKKLCEICVQAGADYVKTSTGFNGTGATLHAVKLMHDTLKGGAKIKASGGIRTAFDAQQFIEAGASRLGTSSGPSLI